MSVPFRTKDRVYAKKEEKKKPMNRPAPVYTDDPVERVCVMNDQDICMRCLERAQEIFMLLSGEHRECPECKWRCKCWGKS